MNTTTETTPVIQETKKEQIQWDCSTDPKEFYGTDDAVTIWETVMTKEKRCSIPVAQISKKLGEEKAKAYAEKIVKCVNMHDELSDGLRKALNMLAIGVGPKEGVPDAQGTKTYIELLSLLGKTIKK